MFAFSKDALDLIGQGTVKKSKMTAETTDTVAPQTSLEAAQKTFAEAATLAQTPYTAAASVDEVAPAEDDDIFFVTNALAVPLAVKYAAKDTARVLIVESSEARVAAAIAAIAEADKDVAVAKGLPFEFTGPKKITVTSAVVLAGLLSKRKNLNPFSHVIISNVTGFSIGMQVLLGQLRRIINNQGAKGHHRVFLCGDIKIGLDIVKPIFNRLKVGGMQVEDASSAEGSLVTIDAVAAFAKKQLVKVPANNNKAPFAPYTTFATEQAKEVLAWAKASLAKVEGAIAIIGQEGIELKDAALPVVDVTAAATTKGLFAVVASSAEDLVTAGVKPVAVVDLGVATVRGANTAAESLLQDPRTEFASTVEMSQRRALAGNHPYFALYPAVVPRPLRSFDAVLSTADRNELLQATRSGLDLRAFVAPIRQSALDEALTSFAELGLTHSAESPVQTFLGEIVSRLTSVSAELGTFVAIATALGFGDVAAAIAAASTTGLYNDVASMTKLRSRYDPDDSNSSDLLADAIVFLTESTHAELDSAKLAAATALQASILRTMANYQPPCEKKSAAEHVAVLTKSAALLAYLLTAMLATTACKISGQQGELLNIRSIERVKGTAEGSVVAFPASGAMTTAASLRKDSATSGITYEGVTIVCNSHFNAAQVILRPVVQHSSAADTNSEGESIVRFAVSSNGLTNNYYVPVEAANRIIEARAAVCSALGLLMLRRLTTPSATSTEEFVAAIRRKRRDFSFVSHMEETARKLEIAVQESPATFVITTFVKKQASVLAPTEVGVVEEGSAPAVATDVISLEGFFEKSITKKDTEADEKKSAEAEEKLEEVVAAAEAAVSTIIDDDDEDYFAKNGPLMDDDDE